MNVLYVGDNRDRTNFGCRATSRALYEIISSKATINHKIMGSILGFSKQGVVPLGKILPSKLYSKVYERRNANLFFSSLNKIESLLGGSPDYIDIDIDKATYNFLKIYKKIDFLDKIYKSLECCDAVIINGEGDMIFEKPYRRSLLFILLIIQLASRLKKPVHFVNAGISDSPRCKRDDKLFNECVEQLNKCQTVICRDPDSYELISPFMRENTLCRYLPDALFTWNRYFIGESSLKPPVCTDLLIGHPEYDEQFGGYDFSIPYICIGGSSSAAWNPKKSYQSYLKVVEKFLSLGYPIYLIEACSGDHFLYQLSKTMDLPFVPVQTPILGVASILANAALFVSGRYHPSILASLGGTPCICMGSNSKKMLSLQKVLEYDSPREYPIYPSNYDLDQMLQRSVEILHQGDSIRNMIVESVRNRSNEAMSLMNQI